MRRSHGPRSARPPTTRSSKSARCRRCPIFRLMSRRQRRASTNCRAARADQKERRTMSDTYLAVFVGSKNSAKWNAWHALPDAERKAKEQEGIAAWKAWVTKHQSSLVEM